MSTTMTNLRSSPNRHAGMRWTLLAPFLLWLCAVAALLSPQKTEAAVLAAGWDHACALGDTGGVHCWGNNEYGQLGNGTTNPYAVPVGVANLHSGATAIAVGGDLWGGHTCALVSGGAVKCWGNNDAGQLGNGTSDYDPHPTPVAVSGLTGATAIAAGEWHTCALVSGGAVKCWGANGEGQLGNGTTTDSTTPVTVSGLTGATAIAAGSNYGHTCAIVSGGTVQCWGSNTSGQLGNGTSDYDPHPTPVAVSGLTGATAIAAGGSHTCALVSGGAVQCWGDLGNGTMGSTTPVTVSGLTGATAIAAGGGDTCALVNGGAVKCWGYNDFGQLGNGSIDNDPHPNPVAVSGLTGATAIAAGGLHTCALVSGGAVKCWGSNAYGQLGDGTTNAMSPVAVRGLTMAGEIAAGGFHTCAIPSASGGMVKCWGGNFDGQLGNGTMTDSTTPVTVSGLIGATAIAAGNRHTCALVSGGAVKCWGMNSDGQLGDGTTTFGYRTIPVPVSGLTGAMAIAAGDRHTCALVSGGTVQCWGGNREGELGNGTIDYGPHPSPVAVSGLTGATAIAAGKGHTCALVSGGAVKCWGDVALLINGSTVGSTTPVAVSGLTGATAIAAGGWHSCALVSGGAVKCWGFNNFGQLGNGSIDNDPHPNPVAVSGLTGATAIAAGGGDTCALVSGGVVKCWGDNDFGQLGNGTTRSSTTPVAVIGLTGATAITAGGELADHTCAISSDGAAKCWGYNHYGQLGNGYLDYVTTSQFPVVGSPFIDELIFVSGGFDGTPPIYN